MHCEVGLSASPVHHFPAVAFQLSENDDECTKQRVRPHSPCRAARRVLAWWISPSAPWGSIERPPVPNLSKIGHGSSCTVWLAEDTTTETCVAVSVQRVDES